MADMKKGKVFATMHFPKNFSSALQKRRDNISILTDAQFRDSELDISIDTGGQFAQFICKIIKCIIKTFIVRLSNVDIPEKTFHHEIF